MKKISFILIALLFLLYSCKNEYVKNPYNVQIDSVLSEVKYPSVAEFLAQKGDFITQKEFPPVLTQYQILGNKNLLLIDIRRKSAYIQGHIDGAYNVPRDSLLYFLTQVKNPAAYDKVVLICYTGQSASYSAALLRFYGIGNVYALKYGMAGWNKKFKGIITKNFSGKYESKMDTTTYPQPSAGDLPNIGNGSPVKIIEKRVAELLRLPAKDFLISADSVFAHPEKYFIISYLPPAKYKVGHPKGAVRYNTRSDLSFYQKLNTLPKDKKIVVYCNIGQHSAATVAYLRLLGYDAYSMKFGLNSFMHNIALHNGWFSDKGFLDLPIITGTERTNKKAGGKTPVLSQPTPSIPTPALKGGGGAPEGGGCE